MNNEAFRADKGTWVSPGASLNPVRGGLFIAPRAQSDPQTPLGVTCASAPLRLSRQPADRSPLTGFGSIITGAGCYKQVTPSGVAGQQAAHSGNACKVQVFRRFGFVNGPAGNHPTVALRSAFSPD
jgi:hypothetical protein